MLIQIGLAAGSRENDDEDELAPLDAVMPSELEVIVIIDESLLLGELKDDEKLLADVLDLLIEDPPEERALASVEL